MAEKLTTQFRAISNGHYEPSKAKEPIVLQKGHFYSLTEEQFKALPKRAQETLVPTDIVLVQKALAEDPNLQLHSDTTRGA